LVYSGGDFSSLVIVRTKCETKMAVAAADQMARLQAEIQNLQAQLQTRPPVTKDLSLVTMVSKWSGMDKAVPLAQFF